MAIDKSKYIGKFLEEGFENVAIVETLLFEIKEDAASNNTSKDNIVTLMRALHTLKGSSRMLDFSNIEALSHALETVFSALKEERIMLNDKAVRLLLAGFDELKTGLNQIKSGEKEELRISIFTKELSALASNEDFSVVEMQKKAVPQAESISVKKESPVQESKASAVGISKGSQKDSSQTESTATAKRNKLEDAKSESIRISLDRINEIIHSMAALQSLEIAARNIARDTEAINEASRHFSRIARNDLSWSSPLLQEFRSMELLVSKLGSMVKNYALDVGNHIRNAYDSVISLRMLPL